MAGTKAILIIGGSGFVGTHLALKLREGYKVFATYHTKRFAIPGVTFYGIKDPAKFDRRTPTVAIRVEGHSPRELATHLGERGIFTWDGSYYAIDLAERLGLQTSGGMLRIGLAHYNTAEEVERLLTELRTLAQ